VDGCRGLALALAGDSNCSSSCAQTTRQVGLILRARKTSHGAVSRDGDGVLFVEIAQCIRVGSVHSLHVASRRDGMRWDEMEWDGDATMHAGDGWIDPRAGSSAGLSICTCRERAHLQTQKASSGREGLQPLSCSLRSSSHFREPFTAE
jgi:hypothetical protein